MPQSCVVTRQEQSGPDYAPIITNVEHPCQGWVDTYSEIDRTNTLILQSDRKAFVLCASLDITPTVNDKLTIAGVTYSILRVDRDPAGAAWIVQARA